MLRDNERKPYEIQLGNKQLIFIFFIAIVICGLFFMVGVKVGKEAKEVELKVARDYATIGVKPSPQETGGQDIKSPEEITLPEPAEKETEPQAEPPQMAKPSPTGEEEPKSQTTPTVKEFYTIQVMAISDRAKAFSIRDNLKNRGYPAYVVTTTGPDNKVTYKVRIGRFATQEEAQKMSQQVQEREKLTTWIARVEQ